MVNLFLHSLLIRLKSITPEKLIATRIKKVRWVDNAYSKFNTLSSLQYWYRN